MTKLVDQPWFEASAAQARALSRRYWAKGGEADQKYPVADDVERLWPIGEAEGDAALQERRRRREAK
jgi:hypothetical protein